jgi:hypothetical protein
MDKNGVLEYLTFFHDSVLAENETKIKFQYKENGIPHDLMISSSELPVLSRVFIMNKIEFSVSYL